MPDDSHITESVNPPGVVSTTHAGSYEQGLDVRESEAMVEEVSSALAKPLQITGHLMTDAEFFSRPVDIFSFSWTTSAVTTTLGYPWRQWTTAPQILNRLQGRTFFRGTLKLLFEFNPTAYSYGLLRMYVSPYDVDKFSAIRAVEPIAGLDGRQSMTLPGVDLDAAIPSSKILELPWIGYTSSFRSVLPNDLVYQYVLRAFPFVPLADAINIFVTPVEVRVRCWVENFESSGPTVHTAVPQSKVVREEKTNGLISAYTGPMRDAAKALGKAPGTIGGLSMAASKALGTATNVLHLLGLSRPVMQDSSPMLTMAPSYSRTDVPDVSQPATFTAGQALTADGSDLGRAKDEMVLSTIVGTDSYLTQFTYGPTTPVGSEVGSIPVHPLCATQTGAQLFITSLAFGSMPFRFWRGSIIYSFRPIVSQFHRGRLRFFYDPNGGSGGAVGAFGATALENCVLDLSPGCEVEITINYNSESYWKPLGGICYPPATVPPGETHCGVLYIRNETALNAPASTANVTILVSVRGGPDFELFGIKEHIPYLSPLSTFATREPVATEAVPPYAPIAGGEDLDVGSGDDYPEPSIPQSAQTSVAPMVQKCLFGGSVVAASPDFVFGERILSLRALLKRYELLGTIKPLNNETGSGTKLCARTVSATIPHCPPMMGFLNKTLGPDGGNVGMQVLSDNILPLTWFKLGYLAHRGSMRYRIEDPGPYSSCINSAATAATVGYPDTTVAVGPTYQAQSNLDGLVSIRTAACGPRDTTTGTESASVMFREHPGFEVPDYNTWSFRLSRYFDGRIFSNAAPSRATQYQAADTNIRITKTVADVAGTIYPVYVSIGDDFSFLYYTGPPVLYTGPPG
jgi:hypothetical protein